MSDHGRAVTITQRMARQMAFEVKDQLGCWQPVPLYGGGGGSRYFGPSYYQCRRSGVWKVIDDTDGRVTGRYCAQHARKHGLLTVDGPIEGVRRD